MCRWVSIIPGITMPPLASISAVPSGTARRDPTAAIRSPATSTSASNRTVCASSIVSTVPPRSTTGRRSDQDAATSSGFAIETSGYLPADDRPLHDYAGVHSATSATVNHRRSGCQAILLPSLTLTANCAGLGWSVHRPWTIVRMTDSLTKGRQRDDGGPGRGAAGRAAGGGLLPDSGRPVRDNAAGRPGRRGGQGRRPGRGRHPHLAAPGAGRHLDLLPRRQPQQ